MSDPDVLIKKMWRYSDDGDGRAARAKVLTAWQLAAVIVAAVAVVATLVAPYLPRLLGISN